MSLVIWLPYGILANGVTINMSLQKSCFWPFSIMLAFALATAPSKAICNRKISFMFCQQTKFRAESKESASHPTSATDRPSAASAHFLARERSPDADSYEHKTIMT